MNRGGGVKKSECNQGQTEIKAETKKVSPGKMASGRGTRYSMLVEKKKNKDDHEVWEGKSEAFSTPMGHKQTGVHIEGTR